MAINFSNYSKKKKSISEAIADLNKKPTFEKSVDERFWKPTLTDKEGSAIIRFLDRHPDEDVPFVKLYSHYFTNVVEGKTRYYTELSLDTIGVKDCVQEHWSRVFKEDKEAAKKFSRNLRFISNILVIKDPANPENNGKVFLYNYSKTIFDKIAAMDSPTDDDEEKIDVFDFVNGCDFKLKAKAKGAITNYDDSSFKAPSPIGTVEYIESIIAQLHPLQPFIAPDQFKSKDELKRKFEWVMGWDVMNADPYGDVEPDEDEAPTPPPAPKILKNKVKAAPKVEDEVPPEDFTKYFGDSEEENEDDEEIPF